MTYKIIITNPAKAQLEHIIDYILSEFGNEQTAFSIMDDAEATRLQLSQVAGSLKLCDDPQLGTLGYRTIHFRHHRYFMLYRIDGDSVYVDAIYHDMQDYEKVIR